MFLGASARRKNTCKCLCHKLGQRVARTSLLDVKDAHACVYIFLYEYILGCVCIGIHVCFLMGVPCSTMVLLKHAARKTSAVLIQRSTEL